ncbi:RNA polymerase sigma factor [Frigidibacter mobilis]|uniref:ECF subfamily RNA polymerase sigma-70 factor n=1 Tax=Frigidibacter mobilis TaxID=1335048 RepID=A0A159Z7T4_9RHOB|nr:sigma-70 family RNA polymerase sigma factor [Frigidibacter mobilis]AMY70604.1 ECF subfamily RNA polymerase sigma-70 factor [Frigidibacter mobilis]
MSDRSERIASLYLSERRRLESIAARRAGRENAADIVHDVFFRLWERAREHTLLGPSYLSRATQNTAISYFRAERRRRAFFSQITEEQYAPPTTIPEEAVVALDELRRLEEVLANLPPRMRKVFLLNRLHHCTYDEIAVGLDISYSTVERDMAKAIMACRQIR